MNCIELKSLLVDNNEREANYSIYPNTTFMYDSVAHIQKLSDGTWRTFYFEKGDLDYLTIHATESEACIRFLKEFYPELLSQIEE